jgi:hypothetical protein
VRTYKYLELTCDPGGVVVLHADTELWEWIVTEVKKYIPACQAHSLRGYTFPSGEAWGYRLHGLQGRDYHVAHWILKQLCLQGWEPFAITTHISGGTSQGLVYHLRFEVGSDSEQRT